jgi:predicted GIY-YIG superfamily endonuclease
MTYLVYALQSIPQPDHFYVGMTTDMEARFRQHNSPGDKHTSKYQPWQLTTTVSFTDETKARRFEAYLKTGSGRAFAKRHF